MQDQKLTLIGINSGVVKEQTPGVAETHWVDADKVRFRQGKPELMGGWQNVTTPDKTADLKGVPRALETARTLDGTKLAWVATNVGVWASDLSDYYHITPLVSEPVSTDALNTTAGSTRVIVSMTNHGLNNDTQIGIVSATATIGGTIQINADSSTERLFLVSVIGDNSFEIDTSTTAAATSAATGGHVTFRYYLNAGTTSNVAVGGWGTGVWSGAFGWSTAPDGTTILPLRIWASDLWGTDIVACPRGGKLYIYKPSAGGISSRMVVVTAAPSINNIVRVASESRHILSYGTHDTTGAYDPLLIRWCSQEDYDDWTPSETNTAGEQRLGSRGSEIISVTKMADKHVILTDADLFIQSYIGPSDVFSFVRAAEKCGSIGPNATTEYKGNLYWMSSARKFYGFDGRVQEISCTVLRYVFDNLDWMHKEKIVCGTNAQFDEIIWIYPSLDSLDGEPDRYVILNPIEGHWTIGRIARTTWVDRSTFGTPLATGVAGRGIYYHEIGYTDDGSPLEAQVSSGFFDQDDGHNMMFCSKLVTDFSDATDGQPITGNVDVYLHARRYPGSDVVTKGPYRVTGGQQRVSTRLRGREFAMAIRSRTIGNEPWRLGEFRLGIDADGER